MKLVPWYSDQTKRNCQAADDRYLTVSCKHSRCWLYLVVGACDLILFSYKWLIRVLLGVFFSLASSGTGTEICFPSQLLMSSVVWTNSAFDHRQRCIMCNHLNHHRKFCCLELFGLNNSTTCNIVFLDFDRWSSKWEHRDKYELDVDLSQQQDTGFSH